MIRWKYDLRHSGKLEYLNALKRLVRNAFAEERDEELAKLIDYLKQTRLVEIDPLFLFKVELEMQWRLGSHAGQLRVFQEYAKHLPTHATMLLEERTNCLLRNGEHGDAYAILAGNLRDLPFSACATLHGCAGWISTVLAEQTENDRYSKRAVGHFEDYIKRLGDGQQPDSFFVRRYINALVSTGQVDQARSAMLALTEAHSLCVAFREELFDLLLSHFPADKEDIRDSILGMLQTIVSVGAPLGGIPHTLRPYLRSELSDVNALVRHEFADNLFLLSYLTCLDVLQSSHDSTKFENALISLESYQLQFVFARLDKKWGQLRSEFPTIIRIIDG